MMAIADSVPVKIESNFEEMWLPGKDNAGLWDNIVYDEMDVFMDEHYDFIMDREFDWVNWKTSAHSRGFFVAGMPMHDIESWNRTGASSNATVIELPE